MGAVICSQPTKTKLLKTFPKYDRALLLRKALSNSGSASENHLHLKTIKLLDKESCYLNLIISLFLGSLECASLPTLHQANLLTYSP